MDVSSTIPKVGAFVWDVGDEPRLQATFDIDKVPTDPSDIWYFVQAPDGTKTKLVYGVNAEIVRLATGVYYVDQYFDAAGQWKFKWQGLGTVKAATKDIEVTVRATVFP